MQDCPRVSEIDQKCPEIVLSTPPHITLYSSSNFVDEENDVLSGVNCHLESTELWAKFPELGTEMIITKTGR